MLRVDVLTIFPEMLRGFLGLSMMKRAVERHAVEFNLVDLRDFARDGRGTLDDRPYGGGPGMIMKPEPLFEAIEHFQTPGCRVVFMTPSGEPFRQNTARRLAGEKHLLFVCGHYEGIDERVTRTLATDEISIGDYVLTNGALPAAVVIDATVRLLPGVLGGGTGATEQESFSDNLLEYPQYTRPPVYRGLAVPELLQCGNHAEMEAWRKHQMLDRTVKRRPDLFAELGE